MEIKSFGHLISDNKRFEKVLWYGLQRQEGALSPTTVKEELNEEFGVDWAKDTWGRYLTALVEVDNHYSSSKVDSAIKRKVVQHQVVKNNRVITELARQNIIADKLEECLQNLHLVKYEMTHIDKNKKVDNTIVCGDIHYTGDSKWVDKMFEDIPKAIGSEPYRLVLNGDITNSILRVGDIYDGELYPIRYASEFAKILVEHLKSTNCHELVIIPGNHEQLRFFKYMGNKQSHVTEIIYELVKALLPSINVIYDVKYENDELHIEHGHRLRGKNKMFKFGETKDKMCIFSHYHKFEVNENVVITPALSASNEYAESLVLESKIGYIIVNDGAIKMRELK